jgi:hypothetical protein
MRGWRETGEAELEQPKVASPPEGFSATFHAELAIEARYVRLHGVFSDVQTVCDVDVGPTQSELVQDVSLTRVRVSGYGKVDVAPAAEPGGPERWGGTEARAGSVVDSFARVDDPGAGAPCR